MFRLPVLASAHQGHPRYFGHGRQCVANSYAAMLHNHKIKTVTEWTKHDMDEVLEEGDRVYKYIKEHGQPEDYLLISDLPIQWKGCRLETLSCFAGSTFKTEPFPPFRSLRDVITKVEYPLFLTLKCNTTAIFKEGSAYYCFDPHSRDEFGLVHADGTAVLTSYSSTDTLLCQLERLAASLGNDREVPYEATSVKFWDLESDSEMDEFDGFSEISDGEYSCLLYTIKENEKEEIDKIMVNSDFSEEESNYSFNDSDLPHQVEDNYPLSQSSNSDDDIPLAVLSKHLRNKDLSGFDLSDNEVNSSGSEYIPTKFEKKLIDLECSESDFSLSEDQVYTIKAKQGMKKKKRKANRKKIATKDKQNSQMKENEEVIADVPVADVPNVYEEVIVDVPGVYEEVIADVPGVYEEVIADVTDMYEEVIADVPGVYEEVIADVPGVYEEVIADVPGVYEEVIADVPCVYEEVIADALGVYEEVIADVPGVYEEVIADVPCVYEEVIVDVPGVYEEVIVDVPGVYEEVIVDVPGVYEEVIADVPGVYEEVIVDVPGVYEEVIADVPGVYEEVIADVTDMYEEVIADVPGVYEEVIVDVPGVYEEVIADVPGVYEEVIADVPGVYEEVIADVPGVYEEVIADVPCVYEEVIADVPGVYEEVIVDVPGVYEEVIADVPGVYEEVIADVPCVYEEVIADVPCVYEEVIADVPGVYEEVIADVPGVYEEVIADVPCVYEEVIADALGVYEEVIADATDMYEEDVIIEAEKTANEDISTNSTSEIHEILNTNDDDQGDVNKENEEIDHDPNESMESIVCEDHNYNLEEKKRSSRKRTRNPLNWERNKRKRSCNSGERYTNSRGKVTHAKEIRKGCSTQCRFKCHSLFNQDDRKNTFHNFWQLGDVNRQRAYILNYSNPQKKRTVKKTASLENKREISYMWSLPLKGNKVRVCKTFFTDTLNISAQRVRTTLKKSMNETKTVEPDKRGVHHSRPNKMTNEEFKFICEHIKTFPFVDSHYCRKSSDRKYLSSDLSVSKMYSLYSLECEKRALSPVSLNSYRHIFNTEFNLYFHKPMKDQCDLCTIYKNASVQERITMKEKYESHIKNKIMSREQKENDKIEAQNRNNMTVACFDLEQVLMTPKAFQSSLFYKRRLNTYNFSIYDLRTTNANCYIWNESISGRGACDIASCVYDFIQERSKNGHKNFVLYSDNCGAQNKNKFYLTMLWYAMQKFELESIEHKYLEKGHTQNQNDSVHACIEKASRNISIYTTGQWAAVAKTACRRNPYYVKEMGMTDFFDFKSLSKILRNFDLDMERKKVHWTGIRTFKIESGNPNIVEIKYDYTGPVHYLDLAHRIRRGNVAPNLEDVVLKRLLNDRPKIALDKYKDLLWLCKSGIIPQCHHMFYAMLPHETEA